MDDKGSPLTDVGKINAEPPFSPPPLSADELNARYDPMTRDELIAECERLRGLLDRALICGRLTGHVLASEIRAALDVPAHPSDYAECDEHATTFPMGSHCPQCSSDTRRGEQ